MAIPNQQACRKNYYRNAKDSLSLINAISITDGGGDYYEIFFPRPFQLLALAYISNLPPAGGYPLSVITLQPTATQDKYKSMLNNLFIAFMYANKDYDPDATVGTTLYTPYSGSLYANYFFNYLNDDLFTVNYNSFLGPTNQVRKFWIDEVLNPDPGTVQERLRQLSIDLFNNSDRALWGAPGTYRLAKGLVTPPDIIDWEPAMVYGSEDSNEISDFNQNYIETPFAPLDNVPPFNLNQPTLAAYWWTRSTVTGEIGQGTDAAPYVGPGGQPDFSTGSVAQSIFDWITAVITAEAGVGPIAGDVFNDPPGTFGAGWGIGINSFPIQEEYTVRVILGAGFAWASGPEPIGNMEWHMKFSSLGAISNYITDLDEYIVEFGILPTLIVDEYKPVE